MTKTKTRRISPLVRHDRRFLKERIGLIGVDEVGRGCLAGPVCASAVYVTQTCYQSRWIRQAGGLINDSKQLSAKQRVEVIEQCQSNLADRNLIVGHGSASVEEIERFNILGATMIAMRRALAELGSAKWLNSQFILLDGKPMRKLGFEHHAVVKGDATSFAIALASIFAKEKRDSLMKDLEVSFPGYGFQTNVGYGTKSHIAYLQKNGACELHRKLFLRKILGDSAEEEKSFVEQAFLFEGEDGERDLIQDPGMKKTLVSNRP